MPESALDTVFKERDYAQSQQVRIAELEAALKGMLNLTPWSPNAQWGEAIRCASQALEQVQSLSEQSNRPENTEC